MYKPTKFLTCRAVNISLFLHWKGTLEDMLSCSLAH